MMIIGDFLELGYVHQSREFVEVKHVRIFAVLAEKGNVLAEIHVLKMICNEASVAALDTLAEFSEDLVLSGHSFVVKSTPGKLPVLSSRRTAQSVGDPSPIILADHLTTPRVVVS